MIATEHRVGRNGRDSPAIPYTNIDSARLAVAVAYAWSPIADVIAGTMRWPRWRRPQPVRPPCLGGEAPVCSLGIG
jgi:hypothetical protein